MSFTIEDARLGNQPFGYGCTGFAGGGKTFSTLLLMQGVQRVKGGDIYVVDTDNTSNAYAGLVPHKRLFLRPPYSADNFREAFEACFKRGARMIVGDCMSEEHDGEGGLLDIRAKIPGKGLDGWGTAKEPRKRMERYMRSLRVNEDVVWGLTYRAELKYKPKTRDEKVRAETEGTPRDPTDHQWDITSTSGVPFMLDVRFLLPPGSDGKPLLKPTTVEEAIFMKSTLTHEAYLKTVTQLNADVGQRLYELSKGSARASSATKLYEVTDKSTGETKPFELTPPQAEGFRKRGFTVVEVPDTEAAE